jgi:uncharacterized membrane protein YedE/YeeE
MGLILSLFGVVLTGVLALSPYWLPMLGEDLTRTGAYLVLERLRPFFICGFVIFVVSSIVMLYQVVRSLIRVLIVVAGIGLLGLILLPEEIKRAFHLSSDLSTPSIRGLHHNYLILDVTGSPVKIDQVIHYVTGIKGWFNYEVHKDKGLILIIYPQTGQSLPEKIKAKMQKARLDVKLIPSKLLTLSLPAASKEIPWAEIDSILLQLPDVKLVKTLPRLREIMVILRQDGDPATLIRSLREAGFPGVSLKRP